MSNILNVTKLTKEYGKKTLFTAVDAITFSLKEKEILGFLGPNGSGKTTTIQMLLGALTPSSGTIEYFGQNFLENRSQILQQVTFASTYTQLPPVLTIEENLKIFGRIYGLNVKQIKANSLPLLEQLGIAHKYKERVATLSSGQLTRLMLVKALFTHPKIVLLDEPTASLDPDVAQEILQLLLKRRDEMGLSILFTSHKMQEVTELCDRVIFIKKGKIIANDVPEALAKQSGKFKLSLLIHEKMDHVERIALHKKYAYQIENHEIALTLDEHEIAQFLQELTNKELLYANVQIKQPSLEDYFLQIARDK